MLIQSGFCIVCDEKYWYRTVDYGVCIAKQYWFESIRFYNCAVDDGSDCFVVGCCI